MGQPPARRATACPATIGKLPTREPIAAGPQMGMIGESHPTGHCEIGPILADPDAR